jgi:sugar lactone lactonase YvrE
MHRPSLRSLALVPASIAAALVLAAPALAVEDCPTQTRARVLYSGDDVLESVAVDRKGHVYFTDSTAGTLMKYRPGRKPRVILDGIDGTGGIVFKRNGDLLVGFGNSIDQASDGEADPEAGLLRVDPRTGKSSVFVDGLQMANGVARGPGGSIFASSDAGTGIDRVQHREVELGWATLVSPNGLIADTTDRYLFANQTFTAAAIQRIPFDHPENAETYYSAGPADIAAGFDGLTRDGQDRLFVAANGAGQVWRVDGPDDACSLFTRDPFPSGPSDLAFGRGHDVIPKTSLIVTTFGGELLELRDAR